MTGVPRHIEFLADAMRQAMNEGYSPPWEALTEDEKQVWADRAIKMRTAYNDHLLQGKRYVA